jgi:hypothetical protein
MSSNTLVSFVSPTGDRWVYPRTHLLAMRLIKSAQQVSYYFSTEAIEITFATVQDAVAFWNRAKSAPDLGSTVGLASVTSVRPRAYRDPEEESSQS